MKKHTSILTTLIIGFAGLMAAGGVLANPNKPMYGMQGMHAAMAGYGKHMMHHKSGMHGQHGRHGYHGAKLLSPHWKRTLTPAQRLQIDRMHLDFAKAKAMLKTRIKALKIELALLSTADQPDSAAIESKIEELLNVKRNMMRIRFGHIVDMRNVLNDEQRLSYDLDVLNKMKRGKKGRRH